MAELNSFIKAQSLNKIMQHHTEAKQWTKNLHANIDRWRKLYNFEHYTKKAKPGENRFPDPTPTNVVDLAVGVFMKNNVEFKAVGWTPSRDEQKTSSMIEKYLLGTLEIATEREQSHVPADVVMNFVRDGVGVLYTVWDPKLDASNRMTVRQPSLQSPTGVLTRKAYATTPVRVEVIDPLKMTMLPGGPRRWTHVFRTEKRSVYDVETEYGISISRYGNLNTLQKMNTEDDFIDYWRVAVVDVPSLQDGEDIVDLAGEAPTEERIVIINAVIFGSQFLKEPEVMRGYEDLPYTFGFFKPVDKDDPGQWHSVLRPIESSIKFLEYAVNRRMKQIDVYSGLPMVVKSAPGRTIQVDPGWTNVKRLSLEEDIAFPQWPGNAPDVEQHINYLRSRLQQAGFSDVMYGLSGSGGEGATFAINQLADQNRIRLELPAKQLETMWTLWARKVLSMTNSFAKNSLIRVYGSKEDDLWAEQVDGAKIGDFLVRAYVQPEFPGEEMRKHAMNTQTADTLSEWTRMERYLDIKQPDEEQERRLIEQALKLPEMQRYGLLKRLMKMARKGDEAAAMTIQMMQSGGVANQGGRPAEPRNPEQLIGVQGPTGQAPPQASGGAAPGQSDIEQVQREANRRPTLEGNL